MDEIVLSGTWLKIAKFLFEPEILDLKNRAYFEYYKLECDPKVYASNKIYKYLSSFTNKNIFFKGLT